MRRILTAALALCLLLTVVHAGAEETEIATVDFAMGFFTGLSGDAVFALPGTASLVRDADSNYFTDSVQLMGYCAADGAEFQLHAGDISGMIEAIREPVMQQLPEADVVITNPTHLAVALKYDKDTAEAPIVIAKGADFLAEKIKDIARENHIEIVENKPVARMLYHNVNIGEEIPPELYQMVAEILAYVYSMDQAG